jgi:hypothetical protein
VNDGSRTKFLLGVLAVLLLFIAWRYLGPSGGGVGDGSSGGDDFGVTTPMGRIPGAGHEIKPPVEEIVDLKVAELQPQAHEYRVGRDPWHFAEPPPPPPLPPVKPPPPPTAEQLQAQREAEERLRRQQEEAARLAAEEAARPKPPPFTWKCIGKFGPPESQIAAFVAPDGKTIQNVRQGGVIEGKFLLSQIGLESVEIRFVDFPNEPAQRLPIGR